MTVVQMYSFVRKLEELGLCTSQGFPMCGNMIIRDEDIKNAGIRFDFGIALLEKDVVNASADKHEVMQILGKHKLYVKKLGDLDLGAYNEVLSKSNYEYAVVVSD